MNKLTVMWTVDVQLRLQAIADSPVAQVLAGPIFSG